MFAICSFVALMTINTASIQYDDQITAEKTFILSGNDKIVHLSSLGETCLIMQGDGNLVLKHINPTSVTFILWSSNTHKTSQTSPQGEYMQLNSNGNLQVIGREPLQTTPVWESGITGHDNRRPYTLVVADKCAYIMDRDTNIFWTSSSESQSTSDCSLYGLDLVIHKSKETRPTSSVFGTALYGSLEFRQTYFNQGRINAIYDWGITLGAMISGEKNNTLYIRDWDADVHNIADEVMGIARPSLQPMSCHLFVLNDKDYIIGYNIYNSSKYVHGITFYSSLGCIYECFGAADTGHMGGLNISNHGIVSYYYDVDDFWYLSGFSGFFGAVIDSLQLQFTQLPPGTNLSTSDTLMCNQTSLDPTTQPSMFPTLSPSNHPMPSPTLHPSIHPTLAPFNDPSHHPTLDPSIHPTSPPFNDTSDDPTPSPTLAPTDDPSDSTPLSFPPTSNPFLRSTTNPVVTFEITIDSIDRSISAVNATDVTSTTERIIFHDKYHIFIVVCVVVVFAFILFIALYFMQKSKRREKKIEIREGSIEAHEIKRINAIPSLSFQERVNDANIVMNDEEGLMCNKANDNGFANSAMDDEKAEIMRWLNTVRLPQYFDCFIQNGYDNMDFIRDIQDLGKAELAAIGVSKQGHQTRLFRQIQKLEPTCALADVKVEKKSESVDEGDVVSLPMIQFERGIDAEVEETAGFVMDAEDMDIDLINVNDPQTKF